MMAAVYDAPIAIRRVLWVSLFANEPNETSSGAKLIVRYWTSRRPTLIIIGPWGKQRRLLTLFVWSGRALQEVFVELSVSGLASMYPASDWSFCSRPSWISARMRSH
jgi:hypothetical protein